MPEQTMPAAFEAWEESAAYVAADLTRSQAITEAREVSWRLADNYTRPELRAVRVWMRRIEGEEAEEFFGEPDMNGWIEVLHRPLNAAQRANLTPMWKVEPKPVALREIEVNRKERP